MSSATSGFGLCLRFQSISLIVYADLIYAIYMDIDLSISLSFCMFLHERKSKHAIPVKRHKLKRKLVNRKLSRLNIHIKFKTNVPPSKNTPKPNWPTIVFVLCDNGVDIKTREVSLYSIRNDISAKTLRWENGKQCQ